MNVWSQIYEATALLTKELGHRRIYAPAAYRQVRALSLVPIVHTEVFDLAALFPTCWTMTPEGPELMALRSLLSDGSAMPGGEKAGLTVLPLAFQAYPFVVPHGEVAASEAVLVDLAIADQPSDIGAPIIMADGQPARATLTRARLALQTGGVLGVTRALSQFAHEEGLLEPWPLKFELGDGESVDIDGLMVLSRARLEAPGVRKAIRAFGVEAGLFFSAHRLSLFRISGLLSAARAVVAARKREVSRQAAA
ncbi:MAG: SapC family protein [Rhizobiales bacterium]|nr:SapC family protein [Hyphomicrobiales bacterium]